MGIIITSLQPNIYNYIANFIWILPQSFFPVYFCSINASYIILNSFFCVWSLIIYFIQQKEINWCAKQDLVFQSLLGGLTYLFSCDAVSVLHICAPTCAIRNITNYQWHSLCTCLCLFHTMKCKDNNPHRLQYHVSFIFNALIISIAGVILMG